MIPQNLDSHGLSGICSQLRGGRPYGGNANVGGLGDAVERGADAARDLPRAKKLAALLYEFTSSKYFPEDSDTEDQFEIKRVEPGKAWCSQGMERREIYAMRDQILPLLR